jgi:hypothetical protein
MKQIRASLGLLGAGLLAGCNLLTAAPTVTIENPGTITATSVTVTVNASGASGIQAVGMSLNGVSLGEDREAPYTFTMTLNRARNGINTLSGYATNNAGGFTYAQPVTFNVNIAPNVTLTTNANSNGVTLNATPSDGVGITKVEFYNGSTLLNTDTAAPYSHTATLAQVANTFPNYSAKIFDAAGNSTTSSERIEDVWENASGARNNARANAVLLDAMPIRSQAGVTLGASLDSTAFGATDIDTDFYAVTLSFAQILKVRTYSATGVDTILRIYDASGNQLAFNDAAGDYNNSDSAVNWRANSNGVYYIGVSSFTDVATPAAQGAAKQYRITVQVGD